MFDGYQSGKLIFKLYGVEEDKLASAKNQILDLSNSNAQLNFSSCSEDYTVEIIKSGNDASAFDKAVKAFINTFSSYIYANESVDLATQVVRLLKLNGSYLCSAESFTGGAIANSIVKISGASEVFYEGIVCYNTQSKIDRLGVNPLTVKTHTVVSREVAFEMVKGLIDGGKCNVAVATTGYASATPGENNGGLCYIAVANETKAEVFRYKLSGDRQEVMKKASDIALFKLVKLLRG